MMGKTLQEQTIADNFVFGAVMTMPDNFILLMSAGNVAGGKGVACGDIFERNLSNTQRLI